MGAGETVEFLDVDVSSRAPAPGEPDRPAGTDDDPPRPRRVGAVVGVLLVAASVLVGARLLGAPPTVRQAVPAPPAPVYGGRVVLPPDFGVPVSLAAVSLPDRDEVYALGTGGRVVRVVDGEVAAVSDGRGYGTLAARPDGRGVFVSTGRFAPAVVALDPESLEVRTTVTATGRVTALTAGVGSVWAASAAGVEGWTTDLGRPLRRIPLPADVTGVRTLAVAGSSLQALVATGAGDALLRLEPPGGGYRLTPGYSAPVSLVPGRVALVARGAGDGTVAVGTDPATPAPGGPRRVLGAGSSIWSTLGVGSALWAASTPDSASLDCFDGAAQLVGRMGVGDSGAGIRGPVVVTARAVYAVTVTDQLARGGHGSCGVPPRASTGGRRGD